MSEPYEVTNQSLFKSEIKDVILEPLGDSDSHLTRKILRAVIVDNADKSAKRVKMKLVHQKRYTKSDLWHDFDDFSLIHLKSGQEAKISLDSEATFKLLTTLQELYELSAAGLPNGRNGIVMIKPDFVSEDAVKLHVLLSHMAKIDKIHWEDIKGVEIDMPVAIALHKIHQVRSRAVADFKAHMEAEDWAEAKWQTFFSENDWIFGYGLAYHFLKSQQEQPHYGGKTYDGAGGQRGDYLMATQAELHFTVLVEIKRPDSSLVSDKRYRNKVYNLSEELTGGVSQVQSNCRTWSQDGARQEETRALLEQASVYTYEPKGILVIGRTSELSDDINKRATFEIFRRNLKNPEIITFDELLARAEFLVSRGPKE
jgi:hypothetical protein